MGFRFRKSIKLFPGVRLNLSKGGMSTSIGRPGATINIGKRGVRGTVGLPGTGLSYSEILDRRDLQAARSTGIEESSGTRGAGLFKIGFLVLVCVLASWLLFGGSHVRPERVPVRQAASPLAQPAKVEQASTSTAMMMADAKCRVEAQKAAAVVETLSEGSSVAVVVTRGGWTEVQTANSRCWVISDYIG
jgi:hypothetical protein